MNMLSNFKLVVFDMAGTTINEDNLVYKALQKVVTNAGFVCSLNDVLSICAGKEKKQAIIDLLNSLNYSVPSIFISKLYEDFILQLNDAYDSEPIFPCEGAINVFESLQALNIKVVLNTGYNRATALQLLEKLNWKIGHQINGLVTASDVTNSRPSPDMIYFAMQLFQIVDPKQVIKIGDSAIDILEGKNAGCGYSIGITTGAQTETELLSANPDFVFSNLLELLPLL
jgi:phosphonatase-like hydrolase